jgi:hypothetical protein
MKLKILTINKNFKPIICSQLINSNKLEFEFKMINNKLIINSNDFEVVDKLLTKNFHKYKVFTV